MGRGIVAVIACVALLACGRWQSMVTVQRQSHVSVAAGSDVAVCANRCLGGSNAETCVAECTGSVTEPGPCPGPSNGTCAQIQTVTTEERPGECDEIDLRPGEAVVRCDQHRRGARGVLIAGAVVFGVIVTLALATSGTSCVFECRGR